MSGSICLTLQEDGGCQSLGLSIISFRKESGSNSSFHPSLQVHNSQLGPAHLYITGGITGSQLGGVPSDQQSMGWAALPDTTASFVTYLFKVDGLDLKVVDAPCPL